VPTLPYDNSAASSLLSDAQSINDEGTTPAPSRQLSSASTAASPVLLIKDRWRLKVHDLPGSAASAEEAEAEEEPPLEVPQEEGDVATVFNMLKGIMGAGGFAMPWAFAHLGLLGGFAVIGICTVFGTWTTGELAMLKGHVESHCFSRAASYVDVARAALGTWGAVLVFALTLLCSLGATSAYLVFISTTIHSMVPVLSQQMIALLAAAAVLPVTWAPNFSFLSKLAQGGTYAVIVGYAVTLYYGAEEALRHGTGWHSDAPQVLIGSPAGIAAGIGPVAFLFCIQAMLFPIMTASSAASAEASAPGSFRKLAAVAFGVAGVINGVFGAACLLLFGSSVSSIVVNDIASGSICLIATKVMLCVDLFCTYPLVFASGRQILETCLLDHSEVAYHLPYGDDGRDNDGIEQEEELEAQSGELLLQCEEEDATINRDADHSKRHWRILIRSCMVLATLGMAQLQDFGLIVSLVGSLGQATLAFVLPPIMALRLCRDSMSTWHRAMNIAILPVGVAVTVLATSATVAEACGISL